jgi:hypothetical protein
MANVLRNKKPTSAFVLSFIGGALILSGGVSMIVVEMLASSSAVPPFLHGIISAGNAMIQQAGFGTGFPYLVAVITGITSGVAVLYAAVMLYDRPSKATKWGSVIIVFSFVSLVGIGGFGLGAVLGILGGAVTFTWAESVYRAVRRPWAKGQTGKISSTAEFLTYRQDYVASRTLKVPLSWKSSTLLKNNATPMARHQLLLLISPARSYRRELSVDFLIGKAPVLSNFSDLVAE